MAVRGFNRDALRRAAQGAAEVLDRFNQPPGSREIPTDSIVRFLRGIPADDTSKKHELTKFFQSSSGQRNTREDRHAAYNDLLGRGRNRDTIG